MKKQKWICIAVSAAACVFSIGLSLVCWYAGFVVEGGTVYFGVGLGLACIAVIALIVTGQVRNARMNRRLERMSAEDTVRFGLKRKEEVERDVKAAERKLDRIVCAGRLWLAASILSLAVFLFCVGGLKIGTEGSIALVLLPCFMLWGLLFVTVAPSDTPSLPECKYQLTRAEYPALYAEVLRAARQAGHCGEIVMTLSGEGTGIAQHRATAIVCVSPQECAIWTKDELYNVMLHEFAHIRYADTARSRRYGRIQEKWSAETVFGGGLLFMNYYAHKLSFEYGIYAVMASRCHEIDADGFVKETGDPQIYADACAKGALLGLYREIPNREMTYELYSGETLPDDCVRRDVAAFRRALDANETVWIDSLRRELPARVDSHPTFRMRLEQMGAETYDYRKVETDSAYLADVDKLIRTTDSLLADEYRAEYAELHRVNYVERTEKMREYGRRMEEGEELSDADMLAYAEAFSTVDDATALAILDRILSHTPDHAYANMCKGLILYYRFDAACVSCFYTAIANDSDLTDEAMQLVGMFALKTGDGELLDRYRAEAAAYADRAMARTQEIACKRGERLVAHGLGQSAIGEIRDGILCAGDGKIRRIACARKRIENKDVVFCAVKIRGVRGIDAKLKILNEIDRCLCKRADDCSYAIADADFQRVAYRAVCAAPNSIVYAYKKEQ